MSDTESASASSGRWAQLPELCLVRVLEHLPMRERIRCAGTCRQWLRVSELPTFWRSLSLSFADESSDAWQAELLQLHGRHCRRLSVSVDQGSEPLRQLALRSLSAAGQFCSQLRSLSLRFTGRNPLFYSGDEFSRRLAELFGQLGSGLRSVDLNAAEIGIRDQLVDALAVAHGDTLEQLLVKNEALVSQLHKEAVLRLLPRCPQLRRLELMNASFSEEALLYLAAHRTRTFQYLALHVSAEVKQKLENRWVDELQWSRVSQLMPQLRVSVAFDARCPLRRVRGFLAPSLPLEELYLMTHTQLSDELSHVAANFGRTLRRLCVLSSEQTPELYAAFRRLADSCGHGLETLLVYCPLPADTVRYVLDKCPRLRDTRRYVFKLLSEGARDADSEVRMFHDVQDLRLDANSLPQSLGRENPDDRLNAEVVDLVDGSRR